MEFLEEARKEDLRILAREMELDITEWNTKITLLKKIRAAPNYTEKEVRDTLEEIIQDREHQEMVREQREAKRIAKITHAGHSNWSCLSKATKRELLTLAFVGCIPMESGLEMAELKNHIQSNISKDEKQCKASLETVREIRWQQEKDGRQGWDYFKRYSPDFQYEQVDEHLQLFFPKLKTQTSMEGVNSVTIDGKELPILRNEECYVDLIEAKYVKPTSYLYTTTRIKQPESKKDIHLPVASVEINHPEVGKLHTWAAVWPGNLNQKGYILGTDTARQIEKKVAEENSRIEWLTDDKRNREAQEQNFRKASLEGQKLKTNTPENYEHSKTNRTLVKEDPHRRTSPLYPSRVNKEVQH